LSLQLHVQPQTEQKLKKILTFSKDEETFAQSFIDYQIAELKRGIVNLQVDFKQFEKKYQMSTEKFYQQFEQGLLDDNEDFLVWAGALEMLLKNKQKLRELDD
jgi:hypothetical protein